MKKQCAITIKNDLSEIARVVQVFDRFWKSHNLADEVVNAVHIAIDEMLSNIVQYAFEDTKEHKIYIKITLNEASVILEIRDDGKPFNPFSFAQTKTDTGSLLMERPIGGLGLHLVSSMMDSCEYHYLNKHNCSIMRKYH